MKAQMTRRIQKYILFDLRAPAKVGVGLEIMSHFVVSQCSRTLIQCLSTAEFASEIDDDFLDIIERIPAR